MIHDAEMVEGHPHSPVAAAVFQSTQARDEDTARAGFGIAGLNEGVEWPRVRVENGR